MESYRLRHYARMFADGNRNDAYRAALAEVISPGASVLDIGTGTGLLAMMACHAGARRVYAVEQAPIIQFARDLAAHNGVADRIVFIERVSTAVRLPERVDAVVSDIRGVLPLSGTAVTSIIDARDRLLRPGGALVPLADALSAAVVSASSTIDAYVSPWTRPSWGVDATPLASAAAQQIVPVAPGDVELLSGPAPWVTIDYNTVTTPSARGTVEWCMPAAATAHGFVLWFEALLAPGISYSTAPGGADTLYGLAFFPWPGAVDCPAQGSVRVDLRADLIGAAYVWTWRTVVDSVAGRREFSQSTFAGMPLARARLDRGRPDAVPLVSGWADVDAAALALMRHGLTLREVARRLCERFPESLPTRDAALARAADLAGRYAISNDDAGCVS
ncbi:MAG TPA: 50S ribosomal protein L11 methyltransferase [Vicinamibacterales bacterium]|nr:50S ribosomal protein L11 methyltransferase [Vicinamibacterales bacterium]